MKKILLTLALISMAWSGQGKNDLYKNNPSPLVRKPLVELPLGAVKPKGWLEDQMHRAQTGLTGHLDEYYSLMGDRNGWLGGDGDKWERGPYWIDGLIPLAYIMDDKALQAKAQRWVEWALSSQQEDGFFGPAEDLPNEPGLQRENARDWWPRMVVLKFMQQYYDATSDERVLTFMDKYFRYQLKTLPSKPLGNWTYWGSERGADNLYIVYWLYSQTGEKYLLELGDLIAQQTADWKGRLTDGKTLNTIYSLHCVNVAQGIKAPVIRYQATKDPSDLSCIDKGYEDIRHFLGWPNGMYGGDEALHSNDPTQGSEFCSAVELMFSLEKMIEITGRTDWADWLERVTFNALPTQASDDFMTRQYYQQANQVNITRQKRNFITDHGGADLCYGILTGYPCCTSNMHQGWPKFTRDLWFASEDGGLAAMYYSPCQVTAKVADGATVRITEGGNYPFSETLTFDVEVLDRASAEFPLRFRVPGWCEMARLSVNGSIIGLYAGGETAFISKDWTTGDKVELLFPMKVTSSRWYENSVSIERGPLVYALKVGESWTRVDIPADQKYGYEDFYYEVKPTTPWNFGLYLDSLSAENIESSFTVLDNATEGSYPWNTENAPLELHVKSSRIPDWTLYNGMAGPMPTGRRGTDLLPEEEIVLIPYGCTTLRISEFPVIRK